MMGAIDAVCTQAARIIGRLADRSSAEGILSPSQNPGRRGRGGSSGQGRKANGRKRKPGVPTTSKRRRPTVEAKLAADAPDGATPLNIPFGNKETALQLGARYHAGRWYALRGLNLTGFRARGWL